MAKIPVSRQTMQRITKTVIAAAPAVAPGTLTGALRKAFTLALDGYYKLPGAKQAAAAAIDKHGATERAIDSLVKQHLAMAGAQGFLTNLGGFETMLLTMPANVTGLAMVEARMVAGIAHLRGYDIDDPRVRSAVIMCLIGSKDIRDLVRRGELPAPMAVATAPIHDEALEQEIMNKVAQTMIANATGRRMAVVATKRIPLVGGGVGAAADGWSTWGIAQYAKSQFVSRKPDQSDR